MNEEEQEQFQSSSICCIYEKLNDHDDGKVRDHCYVTGKVRGAAHWDCNINLQLTKKVPVILHNLRGDSHLIFDELRNFNVKIDVIPNGLEKYIEFLLNKNLVFIDSMQLMNSGLYKLVKNLHDDDFKYLTGEFGSKNLKLLKEKGVYPYEHTNSFERFEERELPKKECFFSSTKKEKIGDYAKKLDGHITDVEYLACKNWNKFGMKNMGNYHNHYLKKDVLLLADVFKKFIDTCLKFYGLDPFHYVSSPGLSWYAMLKMTDIKLEKNI